MSSNVEKITVPNQLSDALGVRVNAIDFEINKAEAELLRSNAVTVEDDRFSRYYGEEIGNLIRPTYDPFTMYQLTQQNNTLQQCIAAMEVNIDGTGWDIERVDGEEVNEDDAEFKSADQFFREPYPDTSFVTMRRIHRRDLETAGNSYWEVIRNLKGEIVFVNNLDAKLTRLVALDSPVAVSLKVDRRGVEQTVTLWVRQRRFAQAIGSSDLVYFKEFGAERALSRTSGKWATESEAVQPDDLATEVIHFTLQPDVITMYGNPRWTSQMPSVLGSRKAEEMNLEFFNSGGLPPAMIFIQGGELKPASQTALTNYLAGKAELKQRAVVVEVFNTSGDLGTGASGASKVTVERFGSERQNDSMFEKYDERSSQRVRGAFRLPPMFLGLNEDYNFATASVSYMVAEAQVFQPERNEFDEIINVTIMKELAPGYKLKSKAINVADVSKQIEALKLVQGAVEPESFVDVINDITDLNLTVKESPDMEDDEEFTKLVDRVSQATAGAPTPTTVTADADGNIIKMDGSGITDLADDWAAHLSGDKIYTDHQVGVMQEVVKAFSPDMRQLFNSYVAGRMVGFNAHDVEGVGELLDCADTCRD